MQTNIYNKVNKSVHSSYIKKLPTFLDFPRYQTKIRGLFLTNIDSIIIKSKENLADLQNRKKKKKPFNNKDI